MPCPINANGRFTLPVAEFVGLHVKDADDEICKHLKAAGRLVKKARYVVRFCWCRWWWW